MKKLSLRLEDLRIDSFATDAPVRKGGTVFGEQCTCATNCTCPGCPTCDASCNGSCGGQTCDASCYGTCGGESCDYCTFDGCYGPTEPGFATIPGPNQMCILC